MHAREGQSAGFQPKASHPKINASTPRSFEVTYPGQEVASSPTNPFPRRPHEVWSAEPIVSPKALPASEGQAEPESSGVERDWSNFSVYATGQTPPDPPQWNGFQAKLTIGRPQDVYEQEADQVAAQVMAMPETVSPVQRQEEAEPEQSGAAIQTKPIAETITPLIQRQAEDEEETLQATSEAAEPEESLQRSANAAAAAPPNLESRLHGSKGDGRPLPSEVRSFMEPRFGTDFSHVRVHTSGDAVQMNREVGAKAFTHGQDIYYGANNAPGNDELTAHELTHVVQQTGNALNATVQRDEQTGGTSTSQGTSAPGTAPNASTPTTAQTEARKLIDKALQDFSQSAFKDITDWSIASDGEKLKLIDKATDLGLGWVGPGDESALERCWASFGAGFEAAVEGNAHLWNRSVKRGVNPEAIPQVKGKYAQFKQEVLTTATDNLYKNEEKVVAEMAQFGIIPSPKFLSPKAASKLMTAATAPPLGGPSPTERLKEQAQLAKVVQNHKQHLEELKKCHVGLDHRQFDPGNPTESHQDMVLYEGMTSWQWVKSTWDNVTAEIALIFNAWPALYAADAQGSLGSFANQSYDKVSDAGGGLPADPLGANGQVQAGLGDVQKSLSKVLENIQSVRDKLEGGDADALDFAPVHSALFRGGAGSRKWSKAIYSPIMSDEREVKDTAAAAAKFAIDAALFVAMIAGVVGTMGGAAIAVGVAAAGALKADTRASELAAAHGAAAGQDTELVSKEAVTAAEMEASSKKIDLAIVTLTSALTIGVEAAAANAAKSPTPGGATAKATGGAAAEESAEGAAGLRSRLNQRQSAPKAPEATPPAATAATAGAMKSWEGVAVDLRPRFVADVVNKRLASDGVPAIDITPVTGKSGAFDGAGWIVQLPKAWFIKDQISEAEFFNMIDMAYHEARHARQWYNVARMKAAEGRFFTPNQLASHLKIRRDIVQKAWSEPLLSADPLHTQTQKIYESVWGANQTQRNQIYAELKASKAHLEAKTQALDSTPKTDANALRQAEAELATAQERRYNAYEAYRNLPEEVDAHLHGLSKKRWAQSGLQNRALVRSAEAKLASAQARLKIMQQRLATLKKTNASSQAVAEADIARALVEEDVKTATTELVRAKNFSAADDWGP
jgi:hypothetical protein